MLCWGAYVEGSQRHAGTGAKHRGHSRCKGRGKSRGRGDVRGKGAGALEESFSSGRNSCGCLVAMDIPYISLPSRHYQMTKLERRRRNQKVKLKKTKTKTKMQVKSEVRVKKTKTQVR